MLRRLIKDILSHAAEGGVQGGGGGFFIQHQLFGQFYERGGIRFFQRHPQFDEAEEGIHLRAGRGLDVVQGAGKGVNGEHGDGGGGVVGRWIVQTAG